MFKENSPLELRVIDVFLPYLAQRQCTGEREPMSSETLRERVDRGVRDRARQGYVP